MHLTISSLLFALVLVAWVRAQADQRISQARDYPHVAFMGWKTENDPSAYNFLSFGSLISEQYILTAAHSTRFEQKKPDIVRLGAVDLNQEDQHVKDYEVSEVITHPNYTARLAYNDIALVRLREPVSFSIGIRPVCLWDSLQMNFTWLVTTALDRTDHYSTSGQLEKFSLDIMDKSVCEQQYGPNRRLPDGMKDHQLCLLHLDQKDICQGISGSPAQISFYPKKCATYVVGIVSHARRCGGSPFPDIYTRVASYIDWIEAIVWS
ncbi:serine protease snake-like isoform X4 [Aedes aegypti]|uniref:serine protease snake-like isoform X4 n=1 Tax=Aedes aegypti TaxID=7159 RepID=UPI000B771A16|nr:serine protease snake-like isoform X4 [Aedes aegypti]